MVKCKCAGNLDLPFFYDDDKKYIEKGEGMTEMGIVLLLWGVHQICTFIKYNYNEHKRLYELYSNKELKE